MSSVPYYIYMLRDPRTARIRYVGQSVNVTQRGYRHSSYPTIALNEWFLELETFPELEVCCIVDGHDEALRVESELISRLRARGEDLLNKNWSIHARIEHGRLLREVHRRRPGISTKSLETRGRMRKAAISSWTNGTRTGTIGRDLSKQQAARWPNSVYAILQNAKKRAETNG